MKKSLFAASALGCLLAVPASAQDGKTTLSFYHPQFGFLAPLIESFEAAHPDIEIDDLAPAENYGAGDQTVIRGVMTGTAPDVYIASYAAIDTLAGVMTDRGIDVSLDAAMQAEGDDWVAANYADRLLALGQVDGTQYAMPFAASLPLLYVNADLIEAAGGEFDNFPTTWNGVIELAQKVSALDGDASGLSFSVGGLSSDWYWQMMVMGAGADMLNADETGIGYDGEAGLAALRATQDMAVKTGMTVYATPTPAQQQFFAGQIAMVVESPSDLVAYETAVGGRFDMRTQKFPLISPEGGLPAGGNALMILSEDEAKREAAWEFVKFMTSAEAQGEVSKASGYMPTNMQTAEALADFYEANPNFLTAFNSMDAAKAWFAYPGNTGPDVWTGIAPVLDQLQRGNITPEEALPQIRDHVARVMASNS